MDYIIGEGDGPDRACPVSADASQTDHETCRGMTKRPFQTEVSYRCNAATAATKNPGSSEQHPASCLFSALTAKERLAYETN
jgi:hypothetical protein